LILGFAVSTEGGGGKKKKRGHLRKVRGPTPAREERGSREANVPIFLSLFAKKESGPHLPSFFQTYPRDGKERKRPPLGDPPPPFHARRRGGKGKKRKGASSTKPAEPFFLRRCVVRRKKKKRGKEDRLWRQPSGGASLSYASQLTEE